MAVTVFPSVAYRAARDLNRTNAALGRNYERLSSGLRIDSPIDDAANYQIATNAQVDSKVYAQGSKNIDHATTYLHTAQEAVTTLRSLTQNLAELGTRASNTALTPAQRTELDTEFQTIATEFNRIVDDTDFDFDPIFTSTNNSITAQDGYGTDARITANLVSGSGVTAKRVEQLGAYDITTSGGGATAASALLTETDDLYVISGEMEAGLSRFDFAEDFSTAISLENADAASKITETDIAAEAQDLIRNQVRQSGAQVAFVEGRAQLGVVSNIIDKIPSFDGEG